MICFFLKHKKNLKYRDSIKNYVARDMIHNDTDCIITFDHLEWREEDTVYVIDVDALDIPHVIDANVLGNVTLVNIDSNTPFTPIIYWYVLHHLSVGKSIQIIEEHSASLYLEKEYFTKQFTLAEKKHTSSVYKKTGPLLAERDKGLDEWSFCIPTGPGDATLLNNLVKQILEYSIPKKEIILCGRPGNNFLYWDQVCIVGEDIPAPPVHITKKKNVLAQAAQYNNLCILHDRVLLPSNFYEAVKQHGDLYPVTTFQSVYTVDKYNVLPMRYSDTGYIVNSSNYLNKCDKLKLLNNKKFFLEYMRKGHFACSSANEHPECNYITGSLYICKKNIWNVFPQNEELFWAEYEDIHFALLHKEVGIPHIVNPFSLSFSQRGRSVIIGTYSSYLGKTTNKTRSIQISRILLFIFPLKSILFLSREEYMGKIYAYVDKYIDERHEPLDKCNNSFSRYKLICHLIMRTRITRTRNFANEWYGDVCKLLLLEQELDNERDEIVNLCCDTQLTDNHLKKLIIKRLFVFRLQTFQSVFAPLFRNGLNRRVTNLFYKIATRNVFKNKSFNLIISKKKLRVIMKNFNEKSHGS